MNFDMAALIESLSEEVFTNKEQQDQDRENRSH